MSGGVDYTSVQVTPDLSPQPDCAHPGARCLRLLVTDLGHPAVPAIAEVLRKACRRAHLTGWSTRHPLPPPPPGITWIVDGRPYDSNAVDTLDNAASDGGCDTILPLTPAALRTVTSAEMRERAEDGDLHLVCPPDPMISLARSRWQLARHLRGLNLPVVPTVRVSRGGDLLAAATDLGYPDTDLTVMSDDVFDDTVWTVRANAGFTDPRRWLPLAAVTTLLDHDPHPAPGTGPAVVRPMPGAEAHPDDPHAGRCTVDLVADAGRIIAVLARRTSPPYTGSTTDNQGIPGVAGTDTVVTLPAPARELVTAVVAGLRWTGPATVGLAGVGVYGSAPVITEVLPWLDPAAYLGAYAGADVLTAAVRHARGEPVPADPVWEPTPVTAHRYHLVQHWAHLERS